MTAPPKTSPSAPPDALPPADAGTERCETLADASFEGVAVVVDDRIVAANRALHRLLGYSQGELTGRAPTELWAEETVTTTGPEASEPLSGPAPRQRDANVTRRDGHRVPAAMLTRPVRWQDREAQAIALRPAIAPRSPDHELSESERRCHALADMLPAAITEADRSGRVMFANRYALERLGFGSPEEVDGLSILDFIAPVDRARAQENWLRRLAGETLPPTRYLLQQRDGRTFPGEVRSAPIERDGRVIGLRSVVVDITDRERLEREHRQLQARVLEAQKLESLGVLAGGIAHDFNNLLTVLMGNAELALLELPAGSPARPYVVDIERAAQRAAELTRQMLAYAGKAPITRREVAINGLIRKMNGLLDLATEHRARIELRLTPGLPWLQADPHQLRHVLLNLVANAVEALEGGEGTVRVETALATLDETAAAALDTIDTALAPGRYVTVAVIDDGRGMDDRARRRVFEPFFSTKFTGRGLGLAAVLGIVRAHDGAITIDTAPGRGARFTVYLPVPDAARQRDPAASDELAAPVLDVLQGRVLVVDDEPDVARVAAALLRRLGLDVRVAHGGRQALELVNDPRQTFGAVLLDATMPDMSGAETLRALRRDQPSLPVILCSGYADQAATPELAEADLAGFVTKPYELRALYSALVHVFPP